MYWPVLVLGKAFGTLPLRTSPLGLVQDGPALILSVFYFSTNLAHACVTPWFVTGESKITATLATAIIIEEVAEDNSTEVVHTSEQLAFIKAMNPLTVSFMCLGSLLAGCTIVRRDLPVFFDDLYQVDLALSPVVRTHSLDLRISLTLFVYFCLLSAPAHIYYVYYSIWCLDGNDLLWNILLGLGNLISFSGELQFVNLALLLQRRFGAVNGFLKRHVVSRSKYSHIISRKIGPEKPVLSLRQVELIHASNMKLCELLKDLNSIYQLQLLTSTAGSFAKTLFNIYFAAISSSLHILSVFKILLWSTFYITRFLVTVIAASFCSFEAFKTRSIVAHVNSRDRSPEIKEELNLFLDHACSWRTTFSACGLYTVNTQLITSALAAGTTYMVVLVQFRPVI